MNTQEFIVKMNHEIVIFLLDKGNIYKSRIYWHSICLCILYQKCDWGSAEHMLRFPDRCFPQVSVFSTTYRRLGDIGNLWRLEHVGPPADFDVQDGSIGRFDEDKTSSTKQIVTGVGISQWKIWSTAHCIE